MVGWVRAQWCVGGTGVRGVGVGGCGGAAGWELVVRSLSSEQGCLHCNNVSVHLNRRPGTHER